MTNSVFTKRLSATPTPAGWRARLGAAILRTSTQRELDLLALTNVVALQHLLDTATGPEIDTWAAANANSLPEIRALLRTLLKLLAARL